LDATGAAGLGDAKVGAADLAGTVWIVPQYWQRQTPPANASSIVSRAWQFVQVIEIMR
jgi:hypothetical protein